MVNSASRGRARTSRWSATEHTDGIISFAIGGELSVAAIYRDPMA